MYPRGAITSVMSLLEASKNTRYSGQGLRPRPPFQGQILLNGKSVEVPISISVYEDDASVTADCLLPNIAAASPKPDRGCLLTLFVDAGPISVCKKC